ncbi:MAG: hypothetical protein IKQ61_05380 [Spirochaetales bacterium]|nr:hypothetical protein [Spirochaetales bacterium]
MRNRYILIFIAVMMGLTHTINATYMTTATSVSWSGAYASIADGLEATLYNPAGVAMSSHKVGLNILGSYSFRFYNNGMSSNDAVRFLQKSSSGENMTDFFHQLIGYLPSTGFNTGFELSLLNFMSFFKFKHFSLGISVLPKTKIDMTVGKSLFSTLFDKIDLSNTLNMSASMTMLQYFDFNGSISTRVKFLEKALHVDGVYAGISTHVYIPTMFVSSVFDEISVSQNGVSNKLGILDYKVRMHGKTRAGVMKVIADNLARYMPAKQVDKDGNTTFPDIQGLMENGGTAGWGLGFDMGAIVQIKRWVRVGFSVTDLGFISFPTAVAVNNDIEVDLTADPTDNKSGFSSYSNMPKAIMSGFMSSLDTTDHLTETTFFMPDTAIRLGVAFTPVLNKFIEITAAADISVTDLNKCINGNVPTFNFATGVEVLPRVNWFEFVFRTAFCYNTESNIPSFSFGTGLHLGALQMEIGVKGLEALIENWGAKEVTLGLDCKFVF